MNNLRLELGMLNCEAVFSAGQFGGLAIFWVDGLDVRFRSKSRHHIDLEITETDGSGLRWRLTCFYGHPMTAQRHCTWSLLRDLSEESQLPWVVVGDFNELLHAQEKEGGDVRREGQMQLFRDALTHSELVDLGFFGAPFTWKVPGMRCPLDRGVAMTSWLDIFPAARVDHLSPIHGDHIPILLGVWQRPMQAVARRRRLFRFESHWTQNEGSMGAVRAGWECRSEGFPMFQAVQKIRNTRYSLNDWQRANYGNRGREIEALRGRLQTLLTLPLTEGNQRESMELSFKLDGLLNDEHAYWKQRAKVTWLKDGDRNSKYFHRKASNRRATEVDHVHMRSVVNLIEPRVTARMNDDLCAEYSAMEIREALFQMYPTKSPGPDVHNPVQVSDLRPIALCNVLYKICSKVVANRLKKILSHLISPFQSAFIPGRLITDNTLIANKVSHYIHTCMSSEGVMSLKLDMSKAYDRMEWKFLEAVLLRFGFAESWVRIIMQCVSTVRYSFLINGQPKGYLTPTRGLRQGDPLSPYLFLLCAEFFSALLDKKASQGLLQGVRVCEGAPVIHHLLFAYDSLLFGVASEEECMHIKSVLKDYELVSGQLVNFSKSNIVFSKKVHLDLQHSLAASLGVEIVAKHEKYLGLPTYVGRSKTETFAFIKERLSKKLEGWQATAASFSSSCWRGIVEAKAVLLRGVRWQVGDGSSIRIWADPWIPRPTLFRPLFRQSSSLSLVSELITASHWDIDTVNHLFDPVDVELILAIPLSSRSIPHRLVWHFDAKGVFTTRFAYVQAIEWLHSPASVSGGLEVSSIWAANVPGKVKVHIWRVCSSILPTVSQLRKKHVFIDEGCLFCNAEEETIEHVSRDCSFVKETLCLCPGLEGQRRKAAREARPWSPPPIGWVKANLDGAFDQYTNCGGLGVIIRDSSGLILGGCCRKVSNVTTPAMVEAFAARLACQFADIMSDEEDASGYGRIVEDISFFQASLSSSYFTHVFRESNSAAHMLAKLALNSSLDLAWSGQFPSSISNFVANHCMN
ncbi:uncharacterized protein LOC133744870 [Rosa rugosa]|uniref:uncharacterized protein LOC133744870 n=1 Tax=Rosa rugosa TaxID=74645 RepID=UPI002B414651|nr:uncharacterized protein LOC133744870 [Rosa rugosa]